MSQISSLSFSSSYTSLSMDYSSGSLGSASGAGDPMMLEDSLQLGELTGEMGGVSGQSGDFA